MCSQESRDFVKLSVNRVDADAYRGARGITTASTTSSRRRTAASSKSVSSDERSSEEASRTTTDSLVEQYEKLERKLEGFQKNTRECEQICQHFRRLKPKYDEVHAAVQQKMKETEWHLAEFLAGEDRLDLEECRQELVYTQRSLENEQERRRELINQALQLKNENSQERDLECKLLHLRNQTNKYTQASLKVLQEYYQPKQVSLQQQTLRAKEMAHQAKLEVKQLTHQQKARAKLAASLQRQVHLSQDTLEERNGRIRQLEERLDKLRTLLEGQVFQTVVTTTADNKVTHTTSCPTVQPPTIKRLSVLQPHEPTISERKHTIQPMVPVLRRSKRRKT